MQIYLKSCCVIFLKNLKHTSTIYLKLFCSASNKIILRTQEFCNESFLHEKCNVMKLKLVFFIGLLKNFAFERPITDVSQGLFSSKRNEH